VLHYGGAYRAQTSNADVVIVEDSSDPVQLSQTPRHVPVVSLTWLMNSILQGEVEPFQNFEVLKRKNKQQQLAEVSPNKRSHRASKGKKDCSSPMAQSPPLSPEAQKEKPRKEVVAEGKKAKKVEEKQVIVIEDRDEGEDGDRTIEAEGDQDSDSLLDLEPDLVNHWAVLPFDLQRRIFSFLAPSEWAPKKATSKAFLQLITGLESTQRLRENLFQKFQLSIPNHFPFPSFAHQLLSSSSPCMLSSSRGLTSTSRVADLPIGSFCIGVPANSDQFLLLDIREDRTVALTMNLKAGRAVPTIQNLLENYTAFHHDGRRQCVTYWKAIQFPNKIPEYEIAWTNQRGIPVKAISRMAFAPATPPPKFFLQILKPKTIRKIVYFLD
jgi:hypothetical protein